MAKSGKIIQSQAEIHKHADEDKLYRRLIENSCDIIFTFCPPGILTFVSPSWTILLGYPADQVIGINLIEFIHPEDVDSCREFLELIIQSGTQKSGIEYRMRHSNGSWRWHSSNGGPLMDEGGSASCFQIISRDITEQRNKKTGLWESELIFTDIFQTIIEGIALTTLSGQVIGINDSLEKILGIPEEDLVGKNILNLDREMLPEPTVENALVLLGDLMKGTNVQGFEFNYQDKILELNASINKGTRRLTGVVHDITDRKRFDEEIKGKNQELNLLNAQKDKFISIIAHDLRSPFQTFMGFISLLADQLENLSKEDIEKIVHSINTSANRLYKLLDNLLEWSRMQRGLIRFHPQALHLKKELSASMAPVHDAALKKRIGISTDIPGDVIVFADTGMFDSLIRNLVFNAVKFTPKDGHVSITARKLPGSFIEISVQDTGIGMNAEILARLFDLDMLPSRSGTEGEPSTGLGLLLCKDYVEKHGGKIWAESKEGQGSTFYFTLQAG